MLQDYMAIHYLQKLVTHLKEHRVTNKAATLSYYILVSFVPILFLLGIFFSTQVIDTSVVPTLSEVVGQEAAETFIEGATHTTENRMKNLPLLIFAAVLSIVTTIRLVSVAGDYLDELWENQVSKSTLKQKIGACIVLVIFALLIFGSTVLASSAPIFDVGFSSVSVTIFTLLLLWGMTTVSFRFLPRKRLPGHVLVKGALLTTFFLALGQIAFQVYVVHSAIGSGTFGLLGTVIIFLLWIYYSTLLYLSGAAATYVIWKNRT